MNMSRLERIKPLADSAVNLGSRLEALTPLTFWYGIGLVLLGIANMASPTGGVALIMFQVWKMNETVFSIFSGLLVSSGLLAILWPIRSPRPSPNWLIWPAAIYVFLIILGSTAGALAGLSSWPTALKTAALHIPHLILLLRLLGEDSQ